MFIVEETKLKTKTLFHSLSTSSINESVITKKEQER